MKKIILLVIVFSLLLSNVGIALAVVHVKGYFKKNGTYVAPYVRTNPNSTITDNYSYPGNYNPNTGKITGGSTTNYTPLYSYTAPTITAPTTINCPKNSTLTDSSCYCNNGFDLSNDRTQCIAKTSCPPEYTLVGNTCYTCPLGYSVTSDLKCNPISISSSIPATAQQTPESQLNFLKSKIADLQRQIALIQAQLAATNK